MNMKSEGVKDVFKWMDKKCKEQKKKVEAAEKNYRQAVREWSWFDDTKCIVDGAEIELEREKAKLQALVEVKISVEKYMRKLRHQGE